MGRDGSATAGWLVTKFFATQFGSTARTAIEQLKEGAASFRHMCKAIDWPQERYGEHHHFAHASAHCISIA